MKKMKITKKAVIISMVYMAMNVVLYICFFNYLFSKKYPNIYGALKKNTLITFLGTFSLIGKKMNYKGQIINILERDRSNCNILSYPYECSYFYVVYFI